MNYHVTRFWALLLAASCSFSTLHAAHTSSPRRLARDQSAVPLVRIERFVVDGRRGQMPDGNDEARVAPGSANLEIHYASPDPVAADPVLFRYRLEGYDRDWIDAGDRRVAYYTNLDSGHYRFVVSATTTAGAWSSPGAALALYVQPYFYQTTWFYAVCGTAIVGLGFSVHRLRVGRIRELQALVDERTAVLERVNAELQRLTTTDGLTALANRRHFDEVLDTEWRRAMRTTTPLACIMIDIDHFKAFNDRWGHLQGDECLKQIGAALRVAVKRASDVVARYGGEEFAVVLPNTDLAGACALAELIRAGVAGLGIPHDASEAGVVTISLGAASVVPGRGSASDTLLVAADRALYRAKRAGKNRVEG